MAPRKRKASGSKRGRASSKGRAKKSSRGSAKRASTRRSAARRPPKTASRRATSKTKARSQAKAKSAARVRTTAKSAPAAKKTTTRAAKGATVPVIRSEPKGAAPMPAGATYGESNWKADRENLREYSETKKPEEPRREAGERPPGSRGRADKDLRESEKRVGEDDTEW